VLVGTDGVSRIADFGIAKGIPSPLLTDKAVMMGRMRTMAPEYLQRRAVDRRLDVYAMGVTLWEAIVAEEPWAGRSDPEIVAEILGAGVPPVPARVGASDELAVVVAHACARDVQARYRSAREMAQAIESLSRGRNGIASHVEVGAFVRDIMGLDMERRRRRIVDCLAARRAASPSAPSGRAARSTRHGAPRRWTATPSRVVLALCAVSVVVIVVVLLLAP
jgi:serine/threonine-protein kinase